MYERIRITILDVNKFMSPKKSRNISKISPPKYPLDKQGSPSYPTHTEKQILIRPTDKQVHIGISQNQKEESV